MIVAVIVLYALAVINASSAFLFSNSFRRSLPSGSYALRAGVSKVKAGMRTDYSHQLLNHLFAGESHDEEDTEEESAELPPQASATIATDHDAPISLMKQGIKFPTVLNGSDVRVGIIMARWNDDIISGLYKGVNESLTLCGVKPSNVYTTYVPGAYELPMTAKFLTASKRFDVIICLGCLIKGETMHFEYISQATSSGIMQVALDSFTPVIFGVLTVLNKQQAIHRSTGTTNEGLSWGRSAVEMGLARMSALGHDQQKKATKSSKSFVTFQSQGGDTTDDNDGKPTASSTGKFGF